MRKSDRPAFTLFETVAAVTIVGLTAVSALAAVGAEMRTAERSRRAIEVEALATQRLDFMTLVSDAGLRTLPDSVANGKFDPPLEGYKWQTTSAPVSTQQGVYDVRITVSWKNGAYTLRTYLYRRPPLATTGAGR